MNTQNWEGMELDKDLLCRGNKVYSPDFCRFVPKRVNVLLNSNKKVRGGSSVGSFYIERLDKYQSNLSIDGKSTYLGLYDSEFEAFLAYKYWKEALIKLVALEERENMPTDIFHSLMNWEINFDD